MLGRSNYATMPGKSPFGQALYSHDWLVALLLLALFLYGGQAGPARVPRGPSEAPAAPAPADAPAPPAGLAAPGSIPRPPTSSPTAPMVQRLVTRAPGRYLPALAGRHVVIDPGHGGPDSGAVGLAEVPEKAIVLDTAIRLQRYLRQYGARVTMTRTSDSLPGGAVPLSLDARLDLLRRAAGEVLVSLHADSSPDPGTRGPTTYYYHADSRWLAQAIQEELEIRLGTPGLGVRPANFYVLRASPVPAVLVEMGFVTHPQEAARLSSPAYRERVAAALADGIARYFASAEPLARAVP